MDKLDEFDKIVANHLHDQSSFNDPRSLLEIDGMIDIEGVNTDLIDNLDLLGPYGAQVPASNSNTELSNFVY